MDDECLEGLKVSEIIQFELAFDGIMNISKKNNVICCYGFSWRKWFQRNVYWFQC
jgi:hypothetical protein